MNFQDKVAIVTGSTRGIGFAIAKRLHDEGATVVITGRKNQDAKDRATLIGERAFGMALEVTDFQNARQVTDQTIERCGRIDILVNNAGISGPFAPTLDYPVEQWRDVIETNLNGTFYCTKAVLPQMLKQKYGRIVNVASMAGKEGNPKMSAYSASKAAVIGFTKSLGKELATTGILVNCITAGVIETDILKGVPQETLKLLIDKIPMGRIAKPEEVAALVTWLCSDECSFSTGAVFDFSGGRATY